MPAATIVLHHDIASARSSFEAGLNITTRPERFAAQLDYFEKHYDLIDLETLLHGPLPRRPLLLTFDDCYRSVLDTTRTLLAPRGIPAVLFTNPDLLGPRAPSLDNVLSWYAARYGLAALQRELGVEGYTTVGALLSGAMALRTATERRKNREHLKQVGGMNDTDFSSRSAILTPEDLRELGSLGVEIGNHTASHVHCRALTEEEREEELVGSRERLERLCGHPVRSFSVPYGNEADLTPDILGTLRRAGHEAIFLVHARSNRFRPAPDIWYRVSLHDEQPFQLNRQLKILPFLRSMKSLVRT